VNNQIYRIVKKAIDEMDYMSLLTEGAPEDEFKLEIIKLCNELSSDDSVDEISQLLANIFNQAFSANDTPEVFKVCASKIWEQLYELNIDSN
jgi:hypothetical protein